jgi:hypothetical protein
VVIPSNHVDLEQSLEPFAIFYDDHGTPTASNGHLNQAIPSPPSGVFRYLRSHDTDTVTWQPQPNVRIAAVIHRVAGPSPGFILAGRSLRMVEEQESLFWRMVFLGFSCWSFFSSPAPRYSAASNVAIRFPPQAFARERGESLTYESAPYPECEP